MNMDHRVDLGRDMAEHLMAPSLLLLPLALALLALALRRGLAPLRDLSDDIDAVQGVPGERLHRPHRFTEFASTVRALHGLLDRLEAQRANERAFASDLAHELRTPLAALALQARAVADGAPPEHARALETEALRAGAILSQLLALARLESGRAPAATTVDLRACAAHVLSDRAQAALDSGHELALQDGGAAVVVQAQTMALELAIRNLVDNALRHTPAGTRIEVSVWSDAQAQGVAVEDWPSGHARDRAPDTDGLGLGLRLVERLLASQGAALHMEHKPSGGRRACIAWPRGDALAHLSRS
jgi:two-component system sensor histidine kinase QseC